MSRPRPTSLRGQDLKGVSPENILDLIDLKKFDTLGMAYILEQKDKGTTIENMPPDAQSLLEHVSAYWSPSPSVPVKKTSFRDYVEDIGHKTIVSLFKLYEIISFLGEVLFSLATTSPRKWRMTSLFYHLDQGGLRAIPIVALMSFLIGIVLAYQGADQLKKFGAEVYTINLVSIGIFREVGILLTAVLVAGRSGSAFAAQIGTMVLREEVDALKTMHINPIDVLVIPRVLALTIAVPLLSFISGFAGLLGGGLTAITRLGLSPDLFLQQAQEAITQWTLWVGLIKAPVFAFSIAIISCFEGLKVQGGAESLGKQTTLAVVEGIFLVIVADALFSILFSALGV